MRRMPLHTFREYQVKDSILIHTITYVCLHLVALVMLTYTMCNTYRYTYVI